MSHQEDILVFPRRFFQHYFAFINWSVVESLIPDLQSTFKWLSRHEAEESLDWIQPISCAIIRDYSGRYCAFRRVRETRDDLKGRVSLVVGGHVDRPCKDMPLRDLLLSTLSREISEEIDVTQVAEALPLGLIIDNSSILSSRHVGFLYLVYLDEPIVTSAPEEFSQRSKITGKFLEDFELAQYHKRFDPWSRLIFEDLIRLPGIRDSPRQKGLPIDI